MRNLDVFNCKWKCCSSKLWFFGLEEKQLVNVRTGIKPGISHRLTVLMVPSFPELLEFKHGILCDHKGESITCKKSVPWSSPIFAPDWIQSSCFPWKHSSKDNLCDPQHEQLWMEIMFSVKWDPTDHCVCDFCSHIHSDPPSSRAQWQGTARATEPLHAGPDSVNTKEQLGQGDLTPSPHTSASAMGQEMLPDVPKHNGMPQEENRRKWEHYLPTRFLDLCQ